MSETHTLGGPSLRDRLFRPNRWRLWVQFALLGAFIIIIPILLTSERLLDAGRNVLVEHEVIDLSDETNLRVTEMREDFSFLSRDLRRALNQADPDRPEAIVRKIQQEVQPVLATTIPSTQPATVRESRQRFMPGAVIGFAVFRRTGIGPAVDVLAFEPGPGEAGRRISETMMVCLEEIASRAARPQPSYHSSLHVEPASPLGRARSILAVGAAMNRGDRQLLGAVVLDFSRYIDNRRRISPRHAYLVTDPTGHLMVHPDPEIELGKTRVQDLLPWRYPELEGIDWLTPLSDPSARERRMALAVHNGGARLEAVEIPSLAWVIRKGTFKQSLNALLGDPARARNEARSLMELLAVETGQDPFLRCGQILPQYDYVQIAHRDPEKLMPICAKIDDWYARLDSQHPVSWSRDLECRSFHGQMTPLRLDLNEEDPVSWLIVAAAREELQEDIDRQFQSIQYRWVLPTLGIACILGIGLVMMLTNSVHRLALSAQKLRLDQNDLQVPLGGPYEVSQLAYALTDLARRVQERDRQIRERAARYETILRAAGEGIIITNEAGIVEEANKAAGRMFGYTPQELIGKSVRELVTDHSALNPSDSTQTVNPPGVSRNLDTVQGLRQDGSLFWLEVSMKPVPLGDRVVITCIFRDISQRKQDEERIRKLNDDLENRVRVRTAELEEANGKLEVALKQAEAAAQAKDAFVANMSHELRQPLHIIIGFTEALKEEADDLGAAEIIPDLNKILSAAQHLLELINDILDLAKISAGRMELSLARFELAKLVEDVRTLVGPLAEKNQNRFQVVATPDLGTMVADERRVRQILINLLSNAFKFTKEGIVTLELEKIEEQGRSWIRFRVRDTGQGMTPAQVSRLFQRFYQADSSTTRNQGGTGLGLAITQSFTELMQGQPIRVISAPGQGSEFIITLPVEVQDGLLGPRQNRPTANLLPARETARETIDHDGRTVLVIDDDPMVRELMSRFLVKEGFRVVQAQSGDEGIELARELRPSVITLDVMMPGLDGWTVLAKLKAHPATSDIPVVMLTIVDDRGRGFALGATDYLTKPIDWQRLSTILKRYLTPGENHRVLVVDDVEENRGVIRRFLERSGCTVVEADNGETGLKAFAEEHPALILLDLMMPVLDGFGFLDELERQHPGHNVPVIVLTAKELTSEDFDRLNGRVARILAKGDLTYLDKLTELIRLRARMIGAAPQPIPPGSTEGADHGENSDRR